MISNLAACPLLVACLAVSAFASAGCAVAPQEEQSGDAVESEVTSDKGWFGEHIMDRDWIPGAQVANGDPMDPPSFKRLRLNKDHTYTYERKVCARGELACSTKKDTGKWRAYSSHLGRPEKGHFVFYHRDVRLMTLYYAWENDNEMTDQLNLSFQTRFDGRWQTLFNDH